MRFTVPLLAAVPVFLLSLPVPREQGVSIELIPQTPIVINVAATPDVEALVPTPTPTAFPEVLTDSDMDRLVTAAGFSPETRDAAKAVAFCESRYRAGAVGDEGRSLGLWQIQPRWHQWRVPGGDLLDPELNARAAYLISNGGTDWSAWTCKP